MRGGYGYCGARSAAAQATIALRAGPRSWEKTERAWSRLASASSAPAAPRRSSDTAPPRPWSTSEHGTRRAREAPSHRQLPSAPSWNHGLGCRQPRRGIEQDAPYVLWRWSRWQSGPRRREPLPRDLAAFAAVGREPPISRVHTSVGRRSSRRGTSRSHGLLTSGGADAMSGVASARAYTGRRWSPRRLHAGSGPVCRPRRQPATPQRRQRVRLAAA